MRVVYLVLSVLIFGIGSCKIRNSSVLQESINLAGLTKYNSATQPVPEVSTRFGDHFDFDKNKKDGYYEFKVRKPGVVRINLNFTHAQRQFTSDPNGQLYLPRVSFGTSAGGKADVKKEGATNQSTSRIGFSFSGEVKPNKTYVIVIRQPSAKKVFDENTFINVGFNHSEVRKATGTPLLLELMRSQNRGRYELNVNNLSSTTNKTVLHLDIRNEDPRSDDLGLYDVSISISQAVNNQNCTFKISGIIEWEDKAGKRQERPLPSQSQGGCWWDSGFNLDLNRRYVKDSKENYRMILTIDSGNANPVPDLRVNASLFQNRRGGQQGPNKIVVQPNPVDLSQRFSRGMFQNGESTRNQGFEFKMTNSADPNEAIIEFRPNYGLVMPINLSAANVKRLDVRKFVVREKGGTFRKTFDFPPNMMNGNLRQVVILDPKKTYIASYMLPYGNKIVQANLNLSLSQVKTLPPENKALTAKFDQDTSDKDTGYFHNVDDLHRVILANKTRWVEHMQPPPSQYPNLTFKAGGSSKTTGLRIKDKVIYHAMQKIRNKYHTVRERSQLSQASPDNYVNPGTISACLGNEAKHWSDLILHFYCQFGGMRGTYTGFVRNEARKIQQLPQNQRLAAAAKLRIEAFKHSLGTAKKDGNRNEKEWYWVKTAKVKVPGDSREYSMATIFEYVMTSTTFQFHMEREQNLINAFYRVKTPRNSTEPTVAECNKERVRRRIDARGANINICKLKKDNTHHNPKLLPAAR